MLVQNWQVVYILFLDAVLALSVNLFNEMLFCSVNKYTIMLIYLLTYIVAEENYM